MSVKTHPLVLALAFILGLAAFILFPQIHQNPTLQGSLAGAAGGLLLWWAVLWLRRAHRPFKLEVSLRPQHYLQAIAHASIFIYWGIYWHPLRDAAVLIVAQVVFAYAFDMLLAWTRRDTFALGFGPFPIIFSTNLFLRFRDDWFYLQFLMIAVGFLAKELIRWDKDGRRVHIFNPSSFTLAVFSLGLILTGTTGMTWGEDIASLLNLPPYIYLFIFVVALPGQFLFRVTSMTLPAVLTTYLFSVVYLRLTGTYFFFDSNVPIAVFLGMHLLFTDPSTAPRTELGRIIFGIIYGLSVVALYWLLARLGAPTFYDKLLQVPIMNLTVRAIDRWAQSRSWAWFNPARLGAGLTPRTRSLAYVTLWLIAFGVMTRTQGLGDHHPGQTIRFWDRACAEGRPQACRNLAALESPPCRAMSGWACNELGILVATGRVEAAAPADLFARACEAGLPAGCENRKAIDTTAPTFQHGDPRLVDFALILQEGRGPLPDTTPLAVYTRACDEGWTAACGDAAGVYLRGDGVAPDKPKAAQLLGAACDGGHARSCANLGLMYKRGDGVAQDDVRATGYLRKACDLGLANACRWLAAPGR